MMREITLLVVAAVVFVLVPQTFQALAHGLEPGLYEIEVKVKMPNIIRPLASMKTRRCISLDDIEEHTAFGILSATPLAKCPRSPICLGDGRSGFQVFCPGRTGGYAEATFESKARSFSGTIQMDMGGKNMSVVEQQDGRRIGNCVEQN